MKPPCVYGWGRPSSPHRHTQGPRAPCGAEDRTTGGCGRSSCLTSFIITIIKHSICTALLTRTQGALRVEYTEQEYNKVKYSETSRSVYSASVRGEEAVSGPIGFRQGGCVGK